MQTQIINAAFQREPNTNKLVFNTGNSRFRELMTRTQKGFVKEFHEGVILFEWPSFVDQCTSPFTPYNYIFHLRLIVCKLFLENASRASGRSADSGEEHMR